MKLRMFGMMLAAFAATAFAQPQDTATVPEPSTFILMGIGLVGVGLAAWRRKRIK